MIEWAEVAPGTVLMATAETAWLHRLAPLDPFARPMDGPGAVETTRTLLDAAIGFFQRRRLAQAAPALTKEGYAERLVGYYHGGHTTPPLLRRAAQRFEGAGRPELVAWARATAEDEDHDHFALADLGELGYPPGVVPTLPCPPFMAALIAYFEACVDGPEPVACLGYIYAVERSSSLIQPSYIEAIDRLLGPGVRATRCLRWHSSMGAEPVHVDRLLGTVAALPAGDRCRVVRAVYETSRILFAESEPRERRPPNG